VTRTLSSRYRCVVSSRATERHDTIIHNAFSFSEVALFGLGRVFVLNRVMWVNVFITFLRHCSGAGIAQWYSCWATGWMIGGSSPGMVWEFFSSPPRPDRLWGLPASYSVGTGDSFPRGKAAGAWSWPQQFNAEVKNAWSYTSVSPLRLRGVVLS
jgi:hypothetical protein